MKQYTLFCTVLLASLLVLTDGWSGGGTIAFTSDRTGNLDIYLIDADGENLTNLTEHPADDYSPSWSPDGRSIVYVSEQNGNPDIYVMNLDTGEQRQLTQNEATDVDPAWSPDGRTIAFASNLARDHAADTDIYTMDTNGKKVTRLTNKGGHNSTPAWSPDSDWIAFRSTHDGIGGLHLMTAEGEKQEALTQVAATHPTWAPNGAQLCFSSEHLAGADTATLFIVDSDGKNGKKLTDGTTPSEQPNWGADGRSIVYVAVREGQQTLAIVDTGGGAVREVTDGFSPVWAPGTFAVSPSADMQLRPWGVIKQPSHRLYTH